MTPVLMSAVKDASFNRDLTGSAGSSKRRWFPRRAPRWVAVKRMLPTNGAVLSRRLRISQRLPCGKGLGSCRQGDRIVQVPKQVIDQERLGQDGRDALRFGEVVILPPDKVQQSDNRGRAVTLDNVAQEANLTGVTADTVGQSRYDAAGGDRLLGRIPDGGVAALVARVAERQNVSRASA